MRGHSAIQLATLPRGAYRVDAMHSARLIMTFAAFHLVADPATAEDYSLRRSRAGDAWDRSQADSCGAPAPDAPGGKSSVSLGMPSLPIPSR